jgi:hypothetical protein
MCARLREGLGCFTSVFSHLLRPAGCLRWRCQQGRRDVPYAGGPGTEVCVSRGPGVYSFIAFPPPFARTGALDVPRAGRARHGSLRGFSGARGAFLHRFPPPFARTGALDVPRAGRARHGSLRGFSGARGAFLHRFPPPFAGTGALDVPRAAAAAGGRLGAWGCKTTSPPTFRVDGLCMKKWRRPTFPRFTAVSSALRGLTSLFGMGRGGPPR